jgi:hypothetical protein
MLCCVMWCDWWDHANDEILLGTYVEDFQIYNSLYMESLHISWRYPSKVGHDTW